MELHAVLEKAIEKNAMKLSRPSHLPHQVCLSIYMCVCVCIFFHFVICVCNLHQWFWWNDPKIQVFEEFTLSKQILSASCFRCMLHLPCIRLLLLFIVFNLCFYQKKKGMWVGWNNLSSWFKLGHDKLVFLLINLGLLSVSLCYIFN